MTPVIPRITHPDAGLHLKAGRYYAAWHVEAPGQPLKRRLRYLRTTDATEARRLRDEVFAALLRKRGSRVAHKGGRPRKQKSGLGMTSAEMKEALNQLDRMQAKRKQEP